MAAQATQRYIIITTYLSFADSEPVRFNMQLMESSDISMAFYCPNGEVGTISRQIIVQEVPEDILTNFNCPLSFQLIDL